MDHFTYSSFSMFNLIIKLKLVLLCYFQIQPQVNTGHDLNYTVATTSVQKNKRDLPNADVAEPRPTNSHDLKISTSNRPLPEKEAAPKKLINITDFGALGDGIHDDTEAFQNAVNAAIINKGRLIIASPSNFYKITDRINIIPVSGQNEVFLDIEAQGNPQKQIVYSGKGGAVFYIKGLRFSVISGLKITIANGSQNVQCFDLDTDNVSYTTGQITFKNCAATLGNGINNAGWRLGHVSGGGADLSNIQWENCTVFGNYGKFVAGQIGWLIEGANTLQNTWIGGFGAFLDRMYSNVSRVGASGTGNGAAYFYGIGASQNNVDYEVANSSTYLISGGRYESGSRFLNVTNSSDAPSITVTGVSIDDYKPTDGILFFLDRPGSLLLQNVSISKGTRPAGYTSSMITCYGGGEGAGIGTLIVDGGSIEATDPFYRYNLNATKWKVYIRGVGKLTNGIRKQIMEDMDTSFKLTPIRK